MGGTTEPISTKLRETYRSGLELGEAIGIAVEALQAASTGNGGNPEVLGVGALEVAVLDRSRPRRKFRRITGRVLLDLLPEANRAVSGGPRELAGGDDAPAGSGAVNSDSGS
jgi:proteasome alpha subunit